MHLKKIIIAILAILPLSFLACGGDNDEPQAPKPTLVLRSQSIADNSTVDASTKKLTLSFNNLIQLVSGKDITLDGKKLQASANGMDLVIALELEHWKTYQLNIPAGAVAVKDHPDVTLPAVTINFDTKTGHNPDASVIVDEKLVNPKATPEAAAVYKKLRDAYGSKMLSGAMCGVGWENTYCDFIGREAGKYPAVVGFDYIFLCYSPANWINYGDLTPVRNVHKKGCIVQIQWHWNVPKTEGSTDYTFRTEGNKFNPANILVEGTWENKVALADVDKLAGYLKLLHDENIPVLWRPFHEAAGDYAWGAWFWWGTKGTDVTKKLWIWLYDKLTNQYGLNNLIWVWTVCTSEAGKPASIEKIRAAYPGHEYVDIVGCDLYPDKELTDQSEQFNILNTLVDGKKMVALSECGNLVDPTKAYANNALWSYFMQWYDMVDGNPGFFNYKGPDQWKTVVSNPLVESR